MKTLYQIKDLDYNQISFIEQSLKRSMVYYEDINTKKPNDKLYMSALKTLGKLFSEVNKIRKSQGEKPQIKMRVVDQKEFNE
jgi:hypothetical protein|tara:strand:+ start:715 stop:960 length:246 start_codon:yes stop_codon:yes gene_type:complete